MKNLTGIILVPIFIVSMCSVYASQTKPEGLMMSATGVFEINLVPQKDEAAPAGRMLIDKDYSGGLVGKGIGQMISKRTASGSAVYFAIEEFDGLLEGKKGAFTLIHNGEMSADSQTLDIKIVDGSGSGELATISGSLEIIQEEKSHKYTLSYKL